ncbi:pyridoxamine 5'-phosphate oxidase family protein [Nocardia sp. 2]|uniref:Pyridoxamine 5'-phosphate oxidase family protein n=1 Tax=Nocardia acididurans TaxID=2802282 RepID=A0ABS1M4M0_9NOCA|nr:pyridoxamine 5'-phosphate oxidase family protein [Nocardia acididurans]MBL1075276.1 pyridoxamine 5'-phosphate oxidase family protein [Nocardia acididurans]
MALTPQERMEFLAQPLIGALSVATTPNRAPLNVPIWYQYAPGGDLWIITGTDSKKNLALQSAGRFSLMAQVLEPTIRYVTAEGPITATTPMTDAENREMATRYLPDDKAEAYLKASADYGDMVTIRMRPQYWLSADLGSL